MTILQSIVLGIVQGATEFLPVSSSAHLVLVPWALGWKFAPTAAFVFDVLVQLGTLAALIVYYWRDLVTLVVAALSGLARRQPFADPAARLAWLIVLASIPAAVTGLAFKHLVEEAFQSPAAVSAFLLVTAVLLFAGERLGPKIRSLEAVTAADALWIGLAQAVALLPGVSRSGSTIAGGLLRGLHRPDAARFAFLMAVPVMIGAGAVATKDLVSMPGVGAEIAPIAAGFVTAAVVGYLVIRWFLSFLARRPLTVFAAYCAVIGVAGLIAGLMRG
jgi:undecaprenyl-diphosphatase